MSNVGANLEDTCHKFQIFQFSFFFISLMLYFLFLKVTMTK